MPIRSLLSMARSIILQVCIHEILSECRPSPTARKSLAPAASSQTPVPLIHGITLVSLSWALNVTSTEQNFHKTRRPPRLPRHWKRYRVYYRSAVCISRPFVRPCWLRRKEGYHHADHYVEGFSERPATARARRNNSERSSGHRCNTE